MNQNTAITPLSRADHAMLVEGSMEERLISVYGLTAADMESHHQMMGKFCDEQDAYSDFLTGMSREDWHHEMGGDDMSQWLGMDLMG